MKDVLGSVVIIILAAGKGTRMDSKKAKVLHHICKRPMVMHVVDTATDIAGKDVVVVVGNQAKEVMNVVSRSSNVIFALQEEQKGTGHAVLTALPFLPKHCQNVVILSGDVPLIKSTTIKKLISEHTNQNHAVSVLGVKLDNPFGYGRILINEFGDVEKIVEESDATDNERKIEIVNSGIYCVKKSFLKLSLSKVQSNNIQNEIYLTDIVEIAHLHNKKVGLMMCDDPAEVMGVNTRQQLQNIESLMLGS